MKKRTSARPTHEEGRLKNTPLADEATADNPPFEGGSTEHPVSV